MIDRRALLTEIIAALPEHPDLAADLRRVLGNEFVVAEVSPATYAREHELAVVTVRKAITEGRLPARHYGRAVRIPRDAVIAPRSRVRRDARRLRAERALGIGGGK